MYPINNVCRICDISVHIRDNAIVCDICNSWVHTRCNWLDKKDYKAFQDDQDKSFYRLLCMNDIMPYSKLNDNEFERISAKGENFSFTYLNNNDPQSPFKQLMYDRINNWINDLNSKTLDDSIFSNEKQTAITLLVMKSRILQTIQMNLFGHFWIP